MYKYEFIELDNLFITQGVNLLIDKEFSIYSKKNSTDDLKIIVNHILDYITTTNAQIKDQQTFGCGSWLIKFVFNNTYIELHELRESINGKNYYDFDISKTISFLKNQLVICNDNNVKPVIPLIGQKIAVSKEILYNQSEVNGVRYDAPNEMSGWYLTSNSYNGDINTLLVEHLYHLLKLRPELAKFLALPEGYRFFKDDIGEDIWYDNS